MDKVGGDKEKYEADWCRIEVRNENTVILTKWMPVILTFDPQTYPSLNFSSRQYTHKFDQNS